MAGVAHHVRHVLHHFFGHHDAFLSGFVRLIVAILGRYFLDVMQHFVNATAPFATKLILFFRRVEDEGFDPDIEAAQIASFRIAHFSVSRT
jgi:hypothetical protein